MKRILNILISRSAFVGRICGHYLEVFAHRCKNNLVTKDKLSISCQSDIDHSLFSEKLKEFLMQWNLRALNRRHRCQLIKLIVQDSIKFNCFNN